MLFDSVMREPPDWKDLVPEFKLRHQQLDALARIHKAMFIDDVDVVLLEAPTGVGKSIIELALCRFFNSFGQSAFIVTPQKALQDQLAKLPSIKPMKGRGSYSCALVPELTAVQAPCIRSASIRESNPECGDTRCPYFKALAEAKAAPVVAHNYASLIAQTHIGGHFETRGLLCLDEGHTAADWIRNYMSIELTLDDLATITTSDPPDDPALFMGWFRAIMSEIDQIPDGVPERIVATIMRVLSHRSVYGVPDGLHDTYTEEMSDCQPEDREPYMSWAIERLSKPDAAIVPWHTASEPIEKGGTKFVCMPIRVAPMANVLTGMGGKVLVVTATILDPELMLRELGLASRPSAEVIIDAAFDPDHRPIHKKYVGSMSYANARDTFPRLVDELGRIIARHANEAGIIHTVSHALAYDVFRAIRDRANGRQVVQMPREGRDGVIEKFLTGGYGPNAILIGPGLMEGIDAKDASARWQAMCKVPWPHRKDPVVSWFLDDPNPRAKRHGERWYMWKTAQHCVQGFGRVCRTPDDFGVTYLLDNGFDKILRSDFVPSYVTAAIIS